MLNVFSKVPFEDLASAVYTTLLESSEILKTLDEDAAEAFWQGLFKLFEAKLRVNTRRFISNQEYTGFWLSYLDGVRTVSTRDKLSSKRKFWKLLTEYLRRYAVDTEAGFPRRQKISPYPKTAWMTWEGDDVNFVGLLMSVVDYKKSEDAQPLALKYDNYTEAIKDSPVHSTTQGASDSAIRSLWRRELDYVVFENVYGVAFDKRDSLYFLRDNQSLQPVIRTWQFVYSDLKDEPPQLTIVSSVKGEPINTRYLFRDYFPITQSDGSVKLLNFYFNSRDLSVRCKHLTNGTDVPTEDVLRVDKQYAHVFQKGRTYVSDHARTQYWQVVTKEAIFARYKMERASGANTLLWVLCVEETYGFDHVRYNSEKGGFNFTAMDAVILMYRLDTATLHMTTLSALLEEYIKRVTTKRKDESEDEKYVRHFYEEVALNLRNLKVTNYDVYLEEVDNDTTSVFLKSVEGLGTAPFSIKLSVTKSTVGVESVNFLDTPDIRSWWIQPRQTRPDDFNFVPKEVLNLPGGLMRNRNALIDVSGAANRVAAASQLCVQLYEAWRSKKDVEILNVSVYLLQYVNVTAYGICFYTLTLNEAQFTFTNNNTMTTTMTRSYKEDNDDKLYINYLHHLKVDTHPIWMASRLDRHVTEDNVNILFMARTSENVTMRSGNGYAFMLSLPNDVLQRKSIIPGVDSFVQRHGFAFGAIVQNPGGGQTDDEELNRGIIVYDVLGNFPKDNREASSLIRMKEDFYDQDDVYLNHGGIKWETESAWWLELPTLSSEEILKFSNPHGLREQVLGDVTVLFFGRYLVLVSGPRNTYHTLHDVSKMRATNALYRYLMSSRIDLLNKN